MKVKKDYAEIQARYDIPANEKGLEKARAISKNSQGKVNNIIDDLTEKQGANIPVESLTSKLDQLRSKALATKEPQTALDAIDEAKTLFETQNKELGRTMLTAREVQDIKQEMQGWAKYGVEQKPLAPEIEKNIGWAARETLEGLNPKLKRFNKTTADMESIIPEIDKRNASYDRTGFVRNKFGEASLLQPLSHITENPTMLSAIGKILNKTGKANDSVDNLLARFLGGSKPNLSEWDIPVSSRELVPTGIKKDYPSDMSARELAIAKKRLEKTPEPSESVAPGIVYLEPGSVTPQSMVTRPYKPLNLPSPSGGNALVPTGVKSETIPEWLRYYILQEVEKKQLKSLLK